MTRTFKIPPRDFSALKAQLNSIGWFLPPFVSVGFIEQRLREHELRCGGAFTRTRKRFFLWNSQLQLMSYRTVTMRVGPIGGVKFAGILIPDAEARVGDLPYLQTAGLADKPAMNLGVDFLARTRLTVDFSSRQFWLARSSCSAANRP